MLLFEALGPEVQREFAHRADSLPRAVFFGRDAASLLAEALAGEGLGSRVAVLFDVRTRDAAGDACLRALGARGFEARTLLVPDDTGHSPVCDDRTRNALQQRLPTCDAIVAIGSGVINDLAKWIAFGAGVPYVAFATASSMNGYASTNVAPKIEGVKSLVAAHAPRYIAADPDVLAAAPHTLTAAGFGDLLAKPVSTADWVLNHEVFGEPHSPHLAAVVDRFDATVFAYPEGLVLGQHETVRSLFDALVLSGCTMTLHGSSLPASGGEHVLSHTLDMMSDADGTPHDLHGRQVGVASVVAAALWGRIVELEHPRFEPHPPPLNRSIWGPAADAVAEQHEAKTRTMERACAFFDEPGAWRKVRDHVARCLVPPSLLRERLQRAGAAWKLADIGCSRERFLAAMEHGGAMRSRFTSLDLARVTGILPRDAEAIVDAWVA